MSKEEERKLLQDRCIAVYNFPPDTTENDVVNAFSCAQLAVFVPDPSARKSDDSEGGENKWIILLENSRAAMKHLSNSIMPWKERQLKIEKIAIACEIPDFWLGQKSDAVGSETTPQSQPSPMPYPMGQGPFPGLPAGGMFPPQYYYQYMMYPHMQQMFPGRMPVPTQQGSPAGQDQTAEESDNSEASAGAGNFPPPFYPSTFPPWAYPQYYQGGEGDLRREDLQQPPSYEATVEKAVPRQADVSDVDSGVSDSESLATLPKKPVAKIRKEEQESNQEEAEEPEGNRMIKVSNIPEGTTDDALTYFFENRRKSGGGPTEEVEYDESTQTAVITFEDANAVQRVLSKLPLLFNKKQITVEEFKPDIGGEGDEEASPGEMDPESGCIIEVRGYKESVSSDLIEMYFENTRRSGGGDVVNIIEKRDEGVIYIEFESESVVERVLSKSHKIEGAPVKVSRYVPPPPPKPVPMYDNKVFIRNISSTTTRDGLENFLEAKAAVVPADVVYGDEEGTALITFEEAVDFEKLKLACQKRTLDKSHLKVEKVPITNCVLVRGFGPTTSQDTLEFYFDNTRRSGGWGVLDVQMNKDEGICIVSFEEPEVVDAVCARKHTVEKRELDVRIYYECLGQVIEDAEMDIFTPPQSLVLEDVDVRKFQFLIQNKTNRTALDKTLEDLYARTDWPKTSEQAKTQPFLIECVLTKEVKDCRKLAKNWAKSVEAEMKKFLNLLVVQKHSTVPDAFKAVLEGLQSLNVSKPDAVAVILEKKDFDIFIVGHKQVVEDVSKQVVAIIEKVQEEMDRRNQRCEDTTTIKHHQVLILQALRFGDEMSQKFPDFQVSYDIKKHSVTFTGLTKEIVEAKMAMFETFNKLSKSAAGNFSKVWQEFLKSTEVKKYVKDKFEENKLVAVWEIDQQGAVLVYSMSDSDAVKASHVLKDSVMESSVKIDRESAALLSGNEWGKKMAEEMENHKGLARIIPDPQKLQIILLCVDSNAGLVRESVSDFMMNYTIYQQSLELPPGVMRFIGEQCSDEVKRVETNLQQDQVKIDVSNNAITIQGTKVGLNKAKRKIDEIVQTIEHKKHAINKAGIGKHLQSPQGQERITKIEKSEHVVIELADEDNERGDTFQREQIATPRRKELAVCVTSRAQKVIALMCDMTEIEVDVLVNAANRDLKHIGGLAKIIVDKGGKEIQDECDRRVNRDGRLMEGEVFTSAAGALRCKMIVHAVGPVWQSGKNNEEDYLREAVMKSMEEGSLKHLKSIAFPALCTGVFGYPAREATRIIAEAVRDFFREYQDSTVDIVYLCDVKEDTVDLFVTGLKKAFGPDSVTDKRGGVAGSSSWQTSSGWETSSKGPKIKAVSPGGGGISVGGGNINIQVIKGQIARQQVDVIVNTTSRDLKLSNGAVSNTLLSVGGPTLQQECNMNYPNGVKHGEVAVTRGGNLQCNFVCHGSLPSWDSSGSSLKILQQFMKNCLDVGHKRGQSSIAFPALGTGNLGYPKDVVAKEMFTAVYKFSSNNPSTSLNDVRFILYEKDHATIKAFEFEEKRQGGGGGGGRHGRQLVSGHNEGGARPKTSGFGSPSYSGSSASSDGSYSDSRLELDIGSITLKVYKGDITQAEVDVIVNSSNPELDLNRGKVSQVIQKMGGKELTQQVQLQKREMKEKGIAVTTCATSRSLHCDTIIHLDIETHCRHIKEMILEALKKADEIQSRSIAFPALGQAFGVQADDLAKQFFKAIIDVQSKLTTLKEVHVILFQQEMITPFMDSLKSCCEKQKPGTFNMIKNALGFGKKGDGVSWERMRSIPLNTATVILMIYGRTLESIESAITRLEGGMKEVFNTKVFEESIIKQFSSQQEQDLLGLEQKYGVEVKVERRIGRVRIEGLSEDLMGASDEIHKMIRRTENKRQEEAEAKLIADMVEWCFLEVTKDGQNLEKYPPQINRLLERALRNQQAEATFKDDQGEEYVVDFSTYEEYPRNNPSDKVTVIRKSKVDGSGSEIPANWSVMDVKENVSVVQLKPADVEYQKVVTDFTSTVGTMYSIVKVERIQNKMLYQQYEAKKRLLDRQNPAKIQNEQILWHGTDSNAVPSINTYGFNRSYCGKNATAYGNGVYFAVSAQYSAGDTYSPRDMNNNKRVYQCKVLTGESARAYHGMKVPPPKPGGGNHILYDSVVDNPNRPGIYVIFNDTQAYPEYLITFK